MVNNYYTLKALVHEWGGELEGSRLLDAFSQVRDELTLAFARRDREMMLRVSVRAPFHYIFRSDGYTRARRNVVTLFQEALDRTVEKVRLAHRDRVIFLDLQGNLQVEILLFGPRANVFLLDPDGYILEAFESDGDWSGKPAPAPRSAVEVRTLDRFIERWKIDRKTTEQALASAIPLFDRTLAAEVIFRSVIDPRNPSELSPAELEAIYRISVEIRHELEHPKPRIYWRGDIAEQFSLVRLQHLEALREEPFGSVDEAVRVFVRRSLGQVRFRELYEPLEKRLADAVAHYRQSTERMLEELSKESRANRYEKWGHLLMAAGEAPPGAEEVVLPDLFSDGKPLTIPLDPKRSAIQNAQAYYERARRTRLSREHAEQRLDEAERMAEKGEQLRARLHEIRATGELEQFRKTIASDPLTRRLLRAEGAEDPDRLPFRQFSLEGGYEVWVGKNARQNDLLTFRYAQKFDLWMHARGVSGSHVILRRPDRHSTPGKNILEEAASIAAYFSKARGSRLVPVIVTERKFVRKPRAAPPGTVVVDREEVLIVEPALPANELDQEF